ncbi:MAG: hypothetical protein LBI02_09780 [Opitutaceae bacterium]|jgi:hypothetical protein|nr:hypothetical protein [Opitutaceae bacterium]
MAASHQALRRSQTNSFKVKGSGRTACDFRPLCDDPSPPASSDILDTATFDAHVGSTRSSLSFCYHSACFSPLFFWQILIIINAYSAIPEKQTLRIRNSPFTTHHSHLKPHTNSEQNLFFWMDSRRAAHFFLFPLYLSLSPRFQPVMGGR